MKKIFPLIVIVFLLATCGRAQKADNKLTVVTSFYPLYEAARQVGGEDVAVQNLVSAGVEPHDYEPAPQEVAALHEADLVLINGAGLEPWVEKLLPDLEKSGVRILNVSELFNDVVLENSLAYDPHFWMDPVFYQQEVSVIARRLAELDPAHLADYEIRAKNFISRLQDLNRAYEDGLKNCRLDSFVTNHAAFGYLAQRYHLKMIPLAGISPDVEPSPKAMSDLVKIIREKKIRYILTESLASQKIATVIAHEAGAETLVLNPLEGLTKEEVARGKNYISVMRENLQRLKTVLECR